MTKQAANRFNPNKKQIKLQLMFISSFPILGNKRKKTYHFEIRQLRFSKFIEFLVGDFLDKERAQNQKEKNESEFYPQR